MLSPTDLIASHAHRVRERIVAGNRFGHNEFEGHDELLPLLLGGDSLIDDHSPSFQSDPAAIPIGFRSIPRGLASIPDGFWSVMVGIIALGKRFGRKSQFQRMILPG
jgi:hypothetical protein